MGRDRDAVRGVAAACLGGPGGSPRGGAGLRGEPFLEGLVEPFHLAAGLRMIGPGVADPDPAQAQLDLQSDPALAAQFAGEHCTVEFLTDVKLRRLV